MRMAQTFWGPNASAARNAARAESTPPDKPTTTRSKPAFLTSLSMKPVRIVRTVSQCSRRSSTDGPPGLPARVFRPLLLRPDEPLEFPQGEFQPLVPQERIGNPRPPQGARAHLCHQEGFVQTARLGERSPRGADHFRSS